MRTTIEIDDRLFRELKRRAAEQGKTLRQTVNDALRHSLAPPPRKGKYVFKWKVEPKGKMNPALRLDDREALFDLLDGL